ILAELLAQDRPPALLHHVRLTEPDLAPVRLIARALDLPLRAVDVADLDYAVLLRRRVAATAGTAHFHQLYLMSVAADLPPAGVIGFDGYLADKLLGLSMASGDIRTRRYCRLSLRRLFPD